MEAIRELLDVNDRTVTLTLPESFTSRRVEVIVLPVQEDIPQPEKAGARRSPSPLLAGTVVAKPCYQGDAAVFVELDDAFARPCFSAT